ncbi:MAG: tRNA (adenosine(37)-N6)-dimethylallyltransferase MiaA [Epulopiscium sp. Nele67-Bin004]|nr:MAG: tRNA (adenosine(37)-N6)-dimethylallyltransferase MiaA [Epulopiscium sp. Nele67-Bin004]
MKPLIIIAGPTASGKTATSISVAKQLNGEIICTDSMQVYKNMDIGTAKVMPSEMEGIPHYMIDKLSPTESSNVAWFKQEVTNYINYIHSRDKVPILVGGTGFYINAIIYDTEFGETEETPKFRQELFAKSSETLYSMLKDVDFESAKNIHPNNRQRVIRAIEFYYQNNNTPISVHNKEEKQKQNTSPYDYLFFALNMDRAVLYERINKRVDIMMQNGLLDEVTNLYNKGLTEDMVSMRAIGYKEFFPYLRGEASLDETIELLKRNTRRYAKRQLTWFTHQANPTFIEVDKLNFDCEKASKIILFNFLNKFRL